MFFGKALPVLFFICSEDEAAKIFLAQNAFAAVSGKMPDTKFLPLKNKRRCGYKAVAPLLIWLYYTIQVFACQHLFFLFIKIGVFFVL